MRRGCVFLEALTSFETETSLSDKSVALFRISRYAYGLLVFLCLVTFAYFLESTDTAVFCEIVVDLVGSRY